FSLVLLKSSITSPVTALASCSRHEAKAETCLHAALPPSPAGHLQSASVIHLPAGLKTKYTEYSFCLVVSAPTRALTCIPFSSTASSAHFTYLSKHIVFPFP